MANSGGSGSINQMIKRMATEAVEAHKPVEIMMGTVIEAVPLLIQTDQKMMVKERFITVAEHLTDFETEISFLFPAVRQEIVTSQVLAEEWSGLDMKFNDEKARHRVMIWNGLKAGDIVYLARHSGGQHYSVIGRRKKNAT